MNTPQLDADFLRSLKPGDHVMAGAGMRAELRFTFVDPETTPHAVVRWLNATPDGRGWWGYHHSRVPWHTVKPV